MLHAVIVDDEPLARRRLLDLIEPLDDVKTVGIASNGKQAVTLITEEKPDVLFLDIQMPGMTGLEVAADVGVDNLPVTVFVTAYDQHALEAFDLAAVDYLLKPFEDERFHETMNRIRERVRLSEHHDLTERLKTLINESSTREPADTLQRIPVEMRGQVRVVPVEEIDFIEADGPYAELHAGDHRYLIRERMQNLEEKLDPRAFIRIHRSTIVAVNRIDTFLVAEGGRYAVRLKNGTRLRVARSRRDAVTGALGIDTTERERK